MLSFERVNLPITKFGELRRYVMELEENQWGKISGFEDEEQLRKAHISLLGGYKYSLKEKLRNKGIRLRCKRNKAELYLLVLKEKL